MRSKLRLAHLPTPLWHSVALDALIGTTVWVKRDDMTAGAEAGNKIRKLEYLLADALDRRATWVITCGAVQSNHARATALLAARLGLRTLLFLRTVAPGVAHAMTGNLLLDQLAGAEIRLITPDQYRRRNELMEEAAAELGQRGEVAYVIPEGGSNGLGALGYVDAMREVREQLDLGLGGGPEPFDAVVHACGSGGTAAGVALGARRYEVASSVLAMAVCDDRDYFTDVVSRIVSEAVALDSRLVGPAALTVHDAWKGPGYGLISTEQRDFLIEVTRRTGMVLDPVYSVKALYALSQLDPKPRRVLFLHTGGLPGLLGQPDLFGEALSA
jgi:D-cysteine desulfhydrase